ncbi:MAG: transcriptional repressor [Alphaproteobacteria bacterium]|nr:transcriptional repressor [Alphaproteobacteria bacterium]
MVKTSHITGMLSGNGLRVTPQRIAILETLMALQKHPTADNIIEYLKKNHPNIATGTIYNTLETFVKKGIIAKVKTDRDVMRYDAVTKNHHHLYCFKSDRIEDYNDPGLQQILEEYFRDHEIPGFRIEDIKLQIIGEFSPGFKLIGTTS